MQINAQHRLWLPVPDTKHDFTSHFLAQSRHFASGFFHFLSRMRHYLTGDCHFYLSFRPSAFKFFLLGIHFGLRQPKTFERDIVQQLDIGQCIQFGEQLVSNLAGVGRLDRHRQDQHAGNPDACGQNSQNLHVFLQ